MATATTAIEPNVKITATKLLINGQWVNSTSGKTFPTINPSTGEVITQVAEADAADVDKAVSAARAAFEAGAWRKKLSASQRGTLMYKLADLIEKNADELAQLEALDNGKPYHVARAADVPLTIACYRYYAGWADKNQGKTIPVNGPYFTYDHPMEFPAPDASLETWPRSRSGLHRGAQACGANPVDRVARRRTHQRSGVPARRG